MHCLAAQALDADRSVGLPLPCDVVIPTERQWTVMQAPDPAAMVALTGPAAMPPVAYEATRKLDKALAAITMELNEWTRPCRTPPRQPRPTRPP
ncbi:hypothetical protein [Streptomyces sp. Ncost-T10-10d]|uniref:hypothetical protein n=1 Tax=Streptomyces sp. Ncost-T10-10d TaxID=1839774 RepID=UPI00081EA16C|nr:hypothetical protein [Streptomyces sp. Ncost-T10-10d]SCF83289.1 hypothetical protein GA0115254_118576 [Streptomyces sp. Ncost-T10-10d]